MFYLTEDFITFVFYSTSAFSTPLYSNNDQLQQAYKHLLNRIFLVFDTHTHNSLAVFINAPHIQKRKDVSFEVNVVGVIDLSVNKYTLLSSNKHVHVHVHIHVL